MKAIVIHAAKDLRIEDQPVMPPGPGEVQITMAAGGICGSDLHYYNHGGFGPIRLREPMVLGHEVSGCRHRALAGTAAIAGKVPGTIASTCGFTARPCPFRIFRARFARC